VKVGPVVEKLKMCKTHTNIIVISECYFFKEG